MKRALVVGLGSMGTRRVRDLLALGWSVQGYDIRPDRRERASAHFGIPCVSKLESAFSAGLDAIVVSTPPDAHQEYYAACFEAGVPFFSEANIFCPPGEWFEKEASRKGIRSMPSATWRFHPSFAFLREKVREPGCRVYSVHHHYAEFLEEWHSNESYTDFYAGQKKTSAMREMVPFEMDALCYVLGPVKSVAADIWRAREWKTDIDDSCSVLLEFVSGLRGSLSVELHPRKASRHCRISCEDIAYDFHFDAAEGFVDEFRARDGSSKRHYPSSCRLKGGFDFEEVYLREMTAFTENIERGIPYIKTWDEERHLSDILFAVEESARSGRRVSIQDVHYSYEDAAW